MLRPKCSSQTCQVYLAEATTQSLPSLKSVSDRRVFWCFCVLFCFVSSALEPNTLMKQGGSVFDFSIWTGGVSLKQMLFVGCHCLFGVGRGAELHF